MNAATDPSSNIDGDKLAARYAQVLPDDLTAEADACLKMIIQLAEIARVSA